MILLCWIQTQQWKLYRIYNYFVRQLNIWIKCNHSENQSYLFGYQETELISFLQVHVYKIYQCYIFNNNHKKYVKNKKHYSKTKTISSGPSWQDPVCLVLLHDFDIMMESFSVLREMGAPTDPKFCGQKSQWECNKMELKVYIVFEILNELIAICS